MQLGQWKNSTVGQALLIRTCARDASTFQAGIKWHNKCIEIIMEKILKIQNFMYYVCHVDQVYLEGLTERNFNKYLPNMPAAGSSSSDSCKI